MDGLLKWMSDNAAELIGGVLIGLLGIIVTVVLYRRSRTVKTLDYVEDYRAPLISKGHEVVGQRVVLTMVGGEQVHSPHVQSITIRNTGNAPVDVSDYRQQMEITCKSAKLVDVQFLSRDQPLSLDFRRNFDGETTEITFPMPLLNSREQLKVQLIWDGEPTDLKVDCHFLGQSRQMRRIQEPMIGRTPRFLVVTVLVSTSVMMAPLLIWITSVGANSSAFILPFVTFLTLAVVGVLKWVTNVDSTERDKES